MQVEERNRAFLLLKGSERLRLQSSNMALLFLIITKVLGESCRLADTTN